VEAAGIEPASTEIQFKSSTGLACDSFSSLLPPQAEEGERILSRFNLHPWGPGEGRSPFGVG